MTVVSMSEREIGRLKVLARIEDGRLSVAAAAVELGLTRRQMHRILKAWRRDGAAGLVSKRRGLSSNRTLPVAWRELVVDTVRSHYHDFGPTFAAEKLKEKHGFVVGRETLRRWLIDDGIWQTRAMKRGRIYQPRNRRDCCGELVQIDGSDHHWFEDRGPPCTLLVFIDDATSQLMHLRFVKSESAFSYFEAMRGYLDQYGRPLALYSDRHSVFHVAAKAGVSHQGLTQFGRAMEALSIEIICANSSQAKGRVERANKTLQDRLVKELRLAQISDIAAANAWIETYRVDHNNRFGKPARDARDLHRLMEEHHNLECHFCWQEERTVSASLTVQYDRMLFILNPVGLDANTLVRQRVTVKEFPDGRVEISFKGHPLPYRIFDKERVVTQGSIVENKRLSEVLSVIRDQQLNQTSTRKSVGPGRQDQASGIFGARKAAHDEQLRGVPCMPSLDQGPPARAKRVISQVLTFQHDKVRYTLVGTVDRTKLIGRTIEVETCVDGSVVAWLDGQQLLVRAERVPNLQMERLPPPRRARTA